MKSSLFLAARIRSAIFGSAGLACLGFAFGLGGLAVAGFVLLFVAYWESGNARVAKAEWEEDAAAEAERAKYRGTAQ